MNAGLSFLDRISAKTKRNRKVKESGLFEILLLIFASVGFFTWHGLWIRWTFDGTRGPLARLTFFVLGVLSIFATGYVAVPLFDGSLKGQGLGALAYLVYIVLPLIIVYAVAGVYGVYRLWTMRKAIANQFSADYIRKRRF